jgi:hypothetical protein
MKLVTLTLLIGFQSCTFVPQALCQDNKGQPEQVHFMIGIPGTDGGRVVLTASTMERDLSSGTTEPVMHLKGKVEAKMITCVPAGASEHRCESAMVLHADEVDYNEKTGEIDARGDVHITPHKVPPPRQ